MSQGPNFDIGTCQKNRVAGFSFFPQYKYLKINITAQSQFCEFLITIMYLFKQVMRFVQKQFFVFEILSFKDDTNDTFEYLTQR